MSYDLLVDYNNIIIKDFIDYIITCDNVDDILENCKTQSIKGFIFERLFDIVIKFGFCNVFPNSHFNHLIGNSNNAKLKILENVNQYLNEKVLSGNSGGCSDITLQNKNDDTYIFISSKYPKSNTDIKKQKSVDYYDIQNIIAMIDDNKHIYKKSEIFLVVPNKKKVLDKVKTANKSSHYITKYMTNNNILDKDDLNKYFLSFKQDIIKNKNNDWQSIYLNSKENLNLRFHQELITQKTSNLIEEGNKSFLWGCKCRSGKTFIFAGVIIKQLKVKNKLNVLIITPVPTETAPQFTNDLFNKFKNFDKFKIHHIEGSKSIDSIETTENNIFVMSKQLLQKYINGKTIKKIKDLKLDIIGFDENHYSGTTDLSKDILRSYSSKNTIKIYLTATYNKPLKDEDDEIQDLPTGKEKVKNDSDSESDEQSDNDESSDEEKEETQISFTKDVLPFVIPLTCLLTIKNSNLDFVKMLNDIKENPELLDTFDDQCLIWWNKKDLIDLIRDIISKYFDKSSNTYNISVQFKMSLQSLIDNPKELLELINDCLKPKEVEKKENGEVFTPMILVNEMLDKLPIEVWKNKNLKWLDPATGMGNFPIAVYLRLMEGLKDEIKDVKERKKHILENMLYMCELNKKNVLVCNQIFDINNEYKLNLYEGDTLVFKPFETFKVKQFDVILGNPPYNKGGIRSHTGKQLGEKNETIWTKFIEKAFKWLKPNGYLAYINPLSWLKKSHSLHNTMLEKHIIWMKLWDNSQSKGMINADIPISLYVLQNSLNTDKKKTEITSILKRRNLTTTSNEYLNKNYSIPLAYHSIFNKLINFIETKNLKLEYSTKTVKSTGTKTKIPLKYKLEDMLAIDTYTIKEGIMIKKATETHPDANKRKLIIANKASFNGAFIDDGKLSLTGNHKFYILGDNLELIIKMLGYKIIDIIGHYTKYGQDFLDNEAFTYLPDIRKLGIEDIDEKQFYKLIGLTQDEIKLFDKKNIINYDVNSLTDEIISDIQSNKQITSKTTIETNNIIINADSKIKEKKVRIKKNNNNEI